jgi:NitT/TauT family transport system ATP-binding protein
MDNLLSIYNLTKSYPSDNGLQNFVIKDLNLSIPLSDKGMIYSIVAPFSAGKTTLLKIISGIENYDSGKVEFSSEVTKIKPFIPESYSTLPWLNVKNNIKIWGKTNSIDFSDNILTELLEDVCLTNYEDYNPQSANSGFQFRVALGRAIYFSPKIILIDDSFKEFEQDTRNEIYNLLKNIVHKYKLNIILATSNIIEAIFLSNKIFLMGKSPAQIIYELENENSFNSIQSMITSETFQLVSKEIQSEFQKRSSIALMHYSV